MKRNEAVGPGSVVACPGTLGKQFSGENVGKLMQEIAKAGD